MQSTSKPNGRRSKKSKSVPEPKPKQELQVKQLSRNWLELPSDLMVNILQRVGVIDVLESAQIVCTTWYEICKDPAIWRVIHMDQYPVPTNRLTPYAKMCKHAVGRSKGKLVDLTITGFGCSGLLNYVTSRSSELRRLEILYPMDVIWGEAFKKLSLLEELSLNTISQEVIEAVGRYCPLLKTLKLNKMKPVYRDVNNDYSITTENDRVLEIGKNLPQLTHLELIRNGMNNIGLQAILDGCRQLESLDLRGCFHVDLQGDLWERCLQQIKDLKCPLDSLEGYHDFWRRCKYFPKGRTSSVYQYCSFDYDYYQIDPDSPDIYHGY